MNSKGHKEYIVPFALQILIQPVIAMEIYASQKWNNTRVQVSAGETYRFEAKGEWIDWHNKCGPEGYDSTNFILRSAEKLRRIPSAKWFALIGLVNQDLATAFVISNGVTKTFNQNGILYCFANDVPFMYWNNKGDIQLTITRIS